MMTMSRIAMAVNEVTFLMYESLASDFAVFSDVSLANFRISISCSGVKYSVTISHLAGCSGMTCFYRVKRNL